MVQIEVTLTPQVRRRKCRGQRFHCRMGSTCRKFITCHRPSAFGKRILDRINLSCTSISLVSRWCWMNWIRIKRIGCHERTADSDRIYARWKMAISTRRRRRSIDWRKSRGRWGGIWKGNVALGTAFGSNWERIPWRGRKTGFSTRITAAEIGGWRRTYFEKERKWSVENGFQKKKWWTYKLTLYCYLVNCRQLVVNYSKKHSLKFTYHRLPKLYLLTWFQHISLFTPLTSAIIRSQYAIFRFASWSSEFLFFPDVEIIFTTIDSIESLAGAASAFLKVVTYLLHCDDN